MMKTLTLIKRNIKLFFKDKGMFLTALITPAILLVLYTTFLGNVYRDSFSTILTETVPISSTILDGLVAGQLVSSLLAVSCITVSFCANFLIVQDKSNGTIKDLRISPISTASLHMSYYFASLLSSLIICITALGICLVYVAVIGWYMSISDVFLLLLDVIILVLFGTALSSLINFFLSSQGQISAVGTIISAGYGFICGAYMPISSFSEGLQKIIMFLPGTYGTSLIRNHTLKGVLSEMSSDKVPNELIEQLKSSLDCNIYFFDNPVEIPTMYAVLITFTALLIIAYILLNSLRKKSKG